jgi:hypothetical protein
LAAGRLAGLVDNNSDGRSSRGCAHAVARLVTTVGNRGMHMPTLVGALPGFSALATKTMQRQMEKIGIPPISELIGVFT